MRRHTFSTHVEAPIEVVFDLWTNLQRMREWVGGVTHVSDVSGPVTVAGTTYVTWFGRMRSPTMVIEADPPHVFVTRFGNTLLRGTNRTTFEPDGAGTLLTQQFATEGIVSEVTGRLFAIGSGKGTFRGELEAFARLAEAESQAGGAAQRA